MAEAKISVEIELLDKSSEEFKKFEQKVLRFKGNVEGSLRQVGNAAKTATKDIKALNAQLNDKSGLASNKAAKGLRVTSQNVKQLAPSANAAKIGFGGMTQGMAAFLGVSAGIGGVVVGFKRLIASGREYSVVLAEIATLTDESSFSAGQQRDIVESLSDKYGVLQNQVGKGLYQTISAGATDAAQATALLRESIGLSIAGVSTVKESVDIMTSTLNSYGEENITASHAADVLFETVKRGKTTMSELASVLGRVLPLAREVGVSFEEVNAAVVSQTKQGASTAEAVTRLRSIFSALIKKQDEVAELLEKRLGIAFDESTIGAIGLAKTLDLLKRATAGNRDELTKLIGRIEGTTGVLALTADNSKLFIEALEGIESASGTAGTALDEFRGSAGRKLEEFTNRIGNEWDRFGERLTVGIVRALEIFGAIDPSDYDGIAGAFKSLDDEASKTSRAVENLRERLRESGQDKFLGADRLIRDFERVSLAINELSLDMAKVSGTARGGGEIGVGFVQLQARLRDQLALFDDVQKARERVSGGAVSGAGIFSLDFGKELQGILNKDEIIRAVDSVVRDVANSGEIQSVIDRASGTVGIKFIESLLEVDPGEASQVLKRSSLAEASTFALLPELYKEAVEKGFKEVELELENGKVGILRGFEELRTLGPNGEIVSIRPIVEEVEKLSESLESAESPLTQFGRSLMRLTDSLNVEVTGFDPIAGSTDEVVKRGKEIADQIEKQTKANEKLLASQEELLRIRKDEAAAMKEGRAKSNAEAEVKLTSVKIKLAKDLLDNKISEYEFSVRSNAVQRAYELEVAKIRSDANARFKAESEDIKKTVASMYDAMIEKAQKLAKQREAALQDEKDLQEVVAQARREGLDSEEKAYAKIDAKFEELTRKALQQTAATKDQINAVLAILEVERLRVIEHQKQLDLQEERLRGEEYLASVIEAGRQNELNIASAIAHMQGESVGQAYDEIAAIEERVRLRREELAAQVEAGVLTSERAAEEVRNMEALANLDRRRVDENLRLRAIQDGAGAFGESFSYGISTAIDNLQTAGDLGRELGNTFASSMGQFASGLATGSASFESFKNIVIGGLLQIIAKWAVLRIVSGLGFGAAGGTGAAGLDNPTTPGGNYVQLNAKGGVMSGSIVGTTSLPVNAYANGGVASTPQLAIFGEGRGAEAFVPLPDGRRIPVDAGGAFTALSAQMRAMTSMMAGGRAGGSSGGNVISLNVDARGAQDAAGVEAAVERSLMKSMPRIEKALGNSMAAGTSGALTRGVRSASRGR